MEKVRGWRARGPPWEVELDSEREQEGARESGQGENGRAEGTLRESEMESTLRRRMSDYKFSHCKI